MVFSLQKENYCHQLNLIWVKWLVDVLSSPKSPFMHLCSCWMFQTVMMSKNRIYAVVPNVIFLISDSLSIFRPFVCFESWVVSWILPKRSREGRERKPKNSKEQKPSWPNSSLTVINFSFKSTMYKVASFRHTYHKFSHFIFPNFTHFFHRGCWTKTTVK